jgi:hypothetical protein
MLNGSVRIVGAGHALQPPGVERELHEGGCLKFRVAEYSTTFQRGENNQIATKSTKWPR